MGEREREREREREIVRFNRAYVTLHSPAKTSKRKAALGTNGSVSDENKVFSCIAPESTTMWACAPSSSSRPSSLAFPAQMSR